MKITVVITIFIFLLSSQLAFAQLNAELIDDFFHSLPTKAYYWRTWETGYEHYVYKSFNTVLLKRPGLKDEYLFQESNIVVLGKASKYSEYSFHYFFYLPDENEQDLKIEILLPNSQSVNYTDNQYAHIANAKEKEHIYSKINQFTHSLEEYNSLYLQELKYPATREENIIFVVFGFGFGIPALLSASKQENNLEKTGNILLGGVLVAGGIYGLFNGISSSKNVRSKRKELVRLKRKLEEIINTE